MPYGLLYAIEFARINPSPEEYERKLDQLIMFLCRYGKQSAYELEITPTIRLQKLADRLNEFLEEERRQAQGH